MDENREVLKKLLLRFLVGRDEARRWLAHGLVRSTIQLASRNNQVRFSLFKGQLRYFWLYLVQNFLLITNNDFKTYKNIKKK